MHRDDGHFYKRRWNISHAHPTSTRTICSVIEGQAPYLESFANVLHLRTWPDRHVRQNGSRQSQPNGSTSGAENYSAMVQEEHLKS